MSSLALKPLRLVYNAVLLAYQVQRPDARKIFFYLNTRVEQLRDDFTREMARPPPRVLAEISKVQSSDDALYTCVGAARRICLVLKTFL